MNCIRMWKDQIQSVGTMIVDAISRCWRSLTPLWDIRAVRLRLLRLESLLLASGSTGRILWLPTYNSCQLGQLQETMEYHPLPFGSR